MTDFLIYLLQSSLTLAVFALCYCALLSRERFFALNRVVLLGGAVVALLLPLCVVTFTVEVESDVQPLGMVALPILATENSAADLWQTALLAVYALGGVLILGWLVRSLCDVLRLIGRAERKRLDDGVVLCLVDEEVAPFSWWQFVVISRADWAQNGDTILRHERAHVRLRHGYDRVAMNLLAVFAWWNPAVWLLRRELSILHEFQADRAVLRSGVDPRQYQLLLIRKSVGDRAFAVAESFNHSSLKTRIAMMLKPKTSPWAQLKTLVLVPLVLLGLASFAQTKEVVKPNLPQEDVLYVVDGEIQSGTLLKDLTKHIAAMSIVKDPAEIAKYGDAARGKKAVVLVTLRKDAAEQVEMLDIRLNGTVSSVRISSAKSSEDALEKTNIDPAKVLYIVDGKPLTGSIADVELNRIVSMELHRDPETLSKYDAAKQGKEVVAIVTLRKETKSAVDPRTAIYVIGDKEVASVEDIDPAKIASVDVHRDPETLSKYRATERGKDKVVIVTLK